MATVAALWRVTELDRLRGIDREHGLTWGAVESRFRYRDDLVVHVVAVRVARFPRRSRCRKFGATPDASRG